MTDLLSVMPAQIRDYRVIEEGEGARLVQCLQLCQGRANWVIAPLGDPYADTALAAHTMASNHVSNACDVGVLLPEQFIYLTCNLAVKQHKLNPLGAAHQPCLQALATMSQLAALSYSECIRLLIDAALIPSTVFAAQTQEALLLWSKMGNGDTQAVLSLLRAQDQEEQFHQRLADLLFANPAMIAHFNQLDNRTLMLLKRATSSDSSWDISRWLNTKDSKANVAHLQRLQNRLSQAVEPMERFTIGLSTATLGSGKGCFKVKSKLVEVDQAWLANTLVSSRIAQGAYEPINGSALPVFRSSEATPSPSAGVSTLNAITVYKIEGVAPTAKTLKQFCELFLLDFDFRVPPVVMDDSRYA